MSSLTLALACLGGVVLTGVMVHGAWQTRHAGPVRPRQVLRTEHREPVLVDPQGPLPSPVMSGGSSVIDDPMMMPARRPQVRIDALIDAIAILKVEAPIHGEMVLAHLPSSRRAGSKPLLIEGLNAEVGEWESPLSGQRYGEFQAGVQLANRVGPLNDIEYSEFVQKVQLFADAIGAMTDFPDMIDAVARGRELDFFASQYDAHLALHLHARATAWSVGYLQQQAHRRGFLPGLVPGRLVLPSTEEGAPPVLTLAFDAQAALADDPSLSAVRDVTLNFDVPQTPETAAPFAMWQHSAQALAQDLDAAIIDDQAQLVGPAAFEAIGAELAQLYGALSARDLAAGSMAARRLFS